MVAPSPWGDPQLDQLVEGRLIAGVALAEIAAIHRGTGNQPPTFSGYTWTQGGNTTRYGPDWFGAGREVEVRCNGVSSGTHAF